MNVDCLEPVMIANEYHYAGSEYKTIYSFRTFELSTLLTG